MERSSRYFRRSFLWEISLSAGMCILWQSLIFVGAWLQTGLHLNQTLFPFITFPNSFLLLISLILSSPRVSFTWSICLYFYVSPSPPCHSPSVGLPPSLLPPPTLSPLLLSAQSHQSSTSIRSSSGHNGDHMLKPALKPNTGRPHQIKPAVSSGALPGSAKGSETISVSASPTRHKMEAQKTDRGHTSPRDIPFSL